MTSLPSQATPPNSPPAATESRAKIKLESVTKRYEDRGRQTEAVADLALTVYENELLCLIGESGCGKSTVLQMIAGFERATEGSVSIDDEPVVAPSERCGVVFQDAALMPWLTVEQNIGLGPAIQRRRTEQQHRVAELMRVLRLEGFEHHRPGQLSGGMSQRVAIGRALVGRPDILLLDEPFGALDAFTRLRLQDELIRLWQDEGCTTVFVTHDIDEAVYLATRIVVLTPRPGRIARIFNVSLRHPRDRTSPEFIRLRGMIAKEFLSLASA